MVRILAAYDSVEGQTRKIAEHIADLASRNGHRVEVHNIRRLPAGFSLEGFAGAILGASIHMGKHARPLLNFIAAHRQQLAATTSAFFSVSLSAAGDEEERQQAQQYIRDFVRQTGWNPSVTASFAGGLLYREYGFVKRWMMKRIARDSGKDTDTSKNHEYTDWKAVDQFVKDFVDRLPKEA